MSVMPLINTTVMTTNNTNRSKLFKGLQKIGFAIPLMFVGPVIINSSFKNSEHPLYYPVLILGILICLFSMFFFFKGLNTMVSGFFNYPNTNK